MAGRPKVETRESAKLDGLKLKVLRVHLGLTQSKFSKMISWSKSKESRIEQNNDIVKIRDNDVRDIVEIISQRYEELNISYEFFESDVDIENFKKLISEKKTIISQSIPSNLPRNDFEFIGREKEIDQLLKDLSSDSKPSVLSITGIGGAGKSALAIEVAKRCEDKSYDAIIWYPPKREGPVGIEFSYNNSILDRKISSVFEELLVTIIDVLNPHPSQHQSSLQDQNTFAIKLLSQKRTLIIIDGLETIDDEQVKEFIDSVPAPTKVLTTDRRWVRNTPRVLLSGLPIEESIEIIKDNCTECNLILDEQEQSYLATETAGIPFAIKWIISQLSSNNWTIDSLSKHLFDNECRFFLEYLFQKSYDQLSILSKIIISSLSLLPVPITGKFLSQCNDIVEKDAKDSLSQLLEHGLIKMKTVVPNYKLVDQIFEMAPLAKIFFRYRKECEENKLRENIIRFLASELTSKIYRSVTLSETKNLQEYLDENCELIASFRDELEQNDTFNYARLNHARNIVFPRKRMTEEIIGFSLERP